MGSIHLYENYHTHTHARRGERGREREGIFRPIFRLMREGATVLLLYRIMVGMSMLAPKSIQGLLMQSATLQGIFVVLVCVQQLEKTPY